MLSLPYQIPSAKLSVLCAGFYEISDLKFTKSTQKEKELLEIEVGPSGKFLSTQETYLGANYCVF